ncbi:MAG TPA: diacylglycerol kinase [Lachnospiraceae bacterium]|nr:diacylglycerol kinase [Lachnospiraceae bacterium]
MNLIAAVDRNWAIGHKGRLLVSIPADHRMFRETTTGKVVVYGRKTLETFPGGQPLKNRTNIILSRNPDYTVRGAVTVHSTDELFEVLKPYPQEDVYVIGGESIYKELLDHCSGAVITRIDYAYSADAFLPDLSKLPEWELVGESEEMTCFDIEFTFQKWRRRKPMSSMSGAPDI